MRHFFTTLEQIAHAESVGTFDGVRRHLQWQIRRLRGAFPCELPISQSKLRVVSPRGVSALVNAMGEYDYNNMRFVRSFLEHSGGTFFDVGANIGSYTLIASEVSAATVISIEPHPHTFGVLADNVRLNARRNVTCLNVAVSDRDGRIGLTDGLESSLNHVLSDAEDAESAAEVPRLEVPTQRLDKACDFLQVIPDLIKIDVEGHEQAVLDGLGRYRDTARAILVERGTRPEIQKWMRGASYSGPWYVHFNRGHLSLKPQGRPEDPLFVQESLLLKHASRNFVDLAPLLSAIRPAMQRSA